MTSSSPDLRDLGVATLRRATEIYLELAYPSGTYPESVRRRIDWPAAADGLDLVTRSPFERSSKPESPAVYALRLGNARYPHMKLQIQGWPSAAGYMLSVNTHDQVLGLDPNAVDAEAFRTLQAENARVKDAIEAQWDAAGFPTFLRYLRDYLDGHAAGIA